MGSEVYDLTNAFNIAQVIKLSYVHLGLEELHALTHYLNQIYLSPEHFTYLMSILMIR